MALFDPTPAQIIIETAPRIYAWTESMEDLSGYECFDDDWLDLECQPETLVTLLEEIGRLYLPYLVSNDAAVRAGIDKLETELDERAWTQNPFPYQSKCLGWIKEGFAGLYGHVANQLRTQLRYTGIIELLAYEYRQDLPVRCRFNLSVDLAHGGYRKRGTDLPLHYFR